MKQNKTLVITAVAFFRASIGCMQRVKRMLEYLNYYLDIKVLYLGRLTTEDIELIKEMNFESIVDNTFDMEVSQEELDSQEETRTKHLEKFYNTEYKVKVKKYLSQNSFDNLMIEYITLDYLINDIQDKYTTVVDTHDLMSSRTASYKEFDEAPSIYLDSLDEEVKILDNYDYILSIQQNEYDLLNTKVDNQKNILVPHAVDIQQQFTNPDKIVNIIFVSGPANFSHIVWFIENVWRYFDEDLDIRLNIYGNVCKKLQQYKDRKNINLKGFIQSLDSLYTDADIVINPVIYGSGLKIKNVEAISNGIPLITTHEGANGIENGIGSVFLLANSIDEWIESLISLIISNKLREELSRNAIEYSQNYFSDRRCYHELVDVLSSPKVV